MKCELVSSLADVNRNEWDSLNTTNHPFTSYDFLNSLEMSESVTAKTGWNPQHIIIKNNTGVKITNIQNPRLFRFGINNNYYLLKINDININDISEIDRVDIESIKSILFMSDDGEKERIIFE